MAVESKVKSGAVVLHGESGGVVGREMTGDETVDREVRDDVAVVNEDGVSVDPVLDVFDAATGFEEDRLVKKGERGSAIGVVGESCGPSFVKMVRIDRKVSDPGVDAMIHYVRDEWAVGEGNEGLGQGVG